MGLRPKVFFVREGSELTRIPFSRFDRLTNGREPVERLPEFAGQTVRYAFVVVHLEKRQPVEVRQVFYGVLKFDASGAPDEVHEAEGDRFMTAGFSPIKPPPRFLSDLGVTRTPNIIEAGSMFARRKYLLAHTWEPKAAVEDQIIAAALGEGV